MTEGKPNYESNLCDSGNILICGDRGSGKLPFIATMLCSLFESSPPNRLRVTVMDTNKSIKHYMYLSSSEPHVRENISSITDAVNCLKAYIAKADDLWRNELHLIIIYDETSFNENDFFMTALKALLQKRFNNVIVLYSSNEIPAELLPYFSTKIAAKISFPHYCEEMGIAHAEHLHAPDELLYLAPGEKEASLRRIVKMHGRDMIRIITGSGESD